LCFAIYKDSKLNNNKNENLFDASVSLWNNYSTAWIEAYNEFIKYYINLTENWLRLGTAAAPPQLNGALGGASMVNEVDIIGANVTAEKQITVRLRYRGNESSPALTVEAGAVRFNLADFLSIFKPMMMSGMRSGVSIKEINTASLLEQSNNSFAKSSLKSSSTLSGKSKLDADWKSPATVIIELAGNTTLDDANFIGIRVH
jgi:hypothetical protein